MAKDDVLLLPHEQESWTIRDTDRMEPVLQLERISVEEMEMKYPFRRLWEEWAVSRENPGGHGENASTPQG